MQINQLWHNILTELSEWLCAAEPNAGTWWQSTDQVLHHSSTSWCLLHKIHYNETETSSQTMKDGVLYKITKLASHAPACCTRNVILIESECHMTQGKAWMNTPSFNALHLPQALLASTLMTHCMIRRVLSPDLPTPPCPRITVL